MTRRPLASVIIDNFNYAGFLREAIDSALGQTYRPLEVIVVDDGSTDASHEIIASYGSRIIAVLKENGGQASAFNAGFAASRGEIVTFLDADDALAPAAIENAASLLAEAGVVKVHWPLWEADAVGARSGKIFPGSPLESGDLLDATRRRGPLAYITSPTSGNAWSRSFLEQVMPVAECGNRHGGDAYLSIVAPLYGRIEKIDEPQGVYRIHARSFSGNQRYQQRTPRLYAVQCRLLTEHFARRGQAVDTKIWKKAEYAWQFEMKRAARELRAAVPVDATVIVLENGQFGPGFLRGRRSLPFLERNGEYWGSPPDDATAVRELERLRQGGAAFLAVAWPAFWWLEHYPQFARHVRDLYSLVLEQERLLLFDMRIDQT